MPGSVIDDVRYVCKQTFRRTSSAPADVSIAGTNLDRYTSDVGTASTTSETRKKQRKTMKRKTGAPGSLPTPAGLTDYGETRSGVSAKSRLKRHTIWMIILFAYSLVGGLAFSAIEGRRGSR
jgi:hypothetical protein